MPEKKRQRWRWSLTIESETDGGVGPPEERHSRFWLMLVLAVLGIAATLAVGAGLLPL